MQPLIDKYIAVFNEPDATRCAALVREAFTDDLRYTDPHAAVRGVDALVEFVGQVHARMPGARFALVGPVDAHHEQARFRWSVTLPEHEAPLAIGFDVVRVVEGRIREVFGFIDQAPA